MARVASNSSDFERSRNVYVVIIQTPVSWRAVSFLNKIPVLDDLHYAVVYCSRPPALTLNKRKMKNAYILAQIYTVPRTHGFK